MKDLEERKIAVSLKAKWLQEAEEKGFPDVDSYIESLEYTLEMKQQILKELFSIISEATELLEKIKEAKQLEIFLPQIDEFLQKINTISK